MYPQVRRSIGGGRGGVVVGEGTKDGASKGSGDRRKPRDSLSSRPPVEGTILLETYLS